MILPATDPVRVKFFNRQRVVGLWVLIICFLILAVLTYVGFLFMRTHIALMDQAGWHQHLKAENWQRFLYLCIQNKECRPELLKAFPGFLRYLPHAILFMLMMVFAGVILVFPRRRKLYTARFAKTFDITKHFKDLDDSYMLPLIQFKDKLIGLQYIRDIRQTLQHVLMTAPSQSGKSVGLKYALASYDGSAVVVDMKGELYQDTSEYRRTITSIFRINLDGKSNYYNPIFDIGFSESELREAAFLLISDPQERDKIFTERAIPAVQAALRAAKLQKKPHIPYLIYLIKQGGKLFIKELYDLQDSLINDNLSIFLGSRPKAFLESEFADKAFIEKGFLNSAWSTLTTRLSGFNNENILKIFGQEYLNDSVDENIFDFTAKDLLQTETTLYLTFPEHLLKSSSKVIALIIQGLVNGMVRYADNNGGSSQIPCVFFLDEAPQYHIPALPNYIATLLGRGISLFVIIQSLAQLKQKYGDDATTLIDNCKAKLYFSPEYETAQVLSRSLGYREIRTSTKSVSSGGQDARKNYSWQKRELITPDELMQIDRDEAILTMQGTLPIRGNRLLHYKDKVIKERLKIS